MPALGWPFRGMDASPSGDPRRILTFLPHAVLHYLGGGLLLVRTIISVSLAESQPYSILRGREGRGRFPLEKRSS